MDAKKAREITQRYHEDLNVALSKVEKIIERAAKAGEYNVLIEELHNLKVKSSHGSLLRKIELELVKRGFQVEFHPAYVYNRFAIEVSWFDLEKHDKPHIKSVPVNFIEEEQSIKKSLFDRIFK